MNHGNIRPNTDDGNPAKNSATHAKNTGYLDGGRRTTTRDDGNEIR